MSAGDSSGAGGSAIPEGPMPGYMKSAEERQYTGAYKKYSGKVSSE